MRDRRRGALNLGSGGHAAVDDQIGTGDVARRVRGEDHGGGGNFVGAGKPSHRDAGQGRGRRRFCGLLAEGSERIGDHLRLREARADAVHADVVPGARAKYGGRLGEEAHRPLAGVIGRQRRVADHSLDRSDIDDRAAAPLHALDADLRSKKHPVEIDVQRLRPAIEGHRLDRLEMPDTRVVDENIDRAQARDHLVQHAIPFLGLRHVLSQENDIVAQRGHRARPFRFKPVRDCDFRAFGLESLCSGEAEPPRPTGHKGALPRQLTHRFPPASPCVGMSGARNRANILTSVKILSIRLSKKLFRKCPRRAGSLGRGRTRMVLSDQKSLQLGMTTRTVERLDRLPRGLFEKFTERRAELAEAALQTLSELGYARTSVREIAQNSAFSHGVLHYYFNDKVDLILCSVRQYKARCITRYDAVVAQARSADELVDGFLDALGDSIRFDGAMHRLWFDLRTQSLFESDYRSDVVDLDKSLEDMIWRVVSRLFELAGVRNDMTPAAAYAIMDGLFQQALLKYLSGQTDAVPNLQADVRAVLTHIAGV